MPNAFSSARASLSSFGRRHDGDVHALQLVHLGVVDLSEDQLIADAQGVVAASIKALGRDAAEVADAGKSDGDEAIEELVHRVAAQRDHGADRHALAHLEGRDGLLGLGGHRLLAGNRGQVRNQRIHDLDVLRGFAQSHVQDDLLEARHRHRVRRGPAPSRAPAGSPSCTCYAIVLCHALSSLFSTVPDWASPVYRCVASYEFRLSLLLLLALGGECLSALLADAHLGVALELVNPRACGPQLEQTSITFEM